MENKNLIIGAAFGYNFEQIKPWVLSINELNIPCERVLCVFSDIDPVTEKKLYEKNFLLVKIKREQNLPPHVLRFFAMYEFLRDREHEYSLVVTTDVRDVIFQKDPFEWLRTNLYPKKLVAGSESLRYKDEPWGNNNLLSAYGPYIHSLFKDNEIFNVGVLGGTTEYMKDLFLQILLNSVNRPISIVDQAVFNVMMYTTPFKDVTFFASQDQAWACQAGTVADPSKMAFFRPHLLGGEPSLKDGVFYTSLGDPFYIVHQYDRVPEWNEYVQRKYQN